MSVASIFQISYELDPPINGQLLLRLFGRDENRKRVDLRVSGAEPYFFAPTAEVGKLAGINEVVRIDPGPPSTTGMPMSKVVTRYPFDVPRVRYAVTYHGEADVYFDVRERGEYHLNAIEMPHDPSRVIPVASLRSVEPPASIVPRILSIDIEVEDRFGFSKPQDPQAPVLSVAFHDDYLNAYGVAYQGPPVDVEAVRGAMNQHLRSSGCPEDQLITEPIHLFPRSNERDVVAGFGDCLARSEPDMVSAYNGYGYDFPYLANRVSKRLLQDDPGNPDLLRVFHSLDEHESRTHGRYAVADPLLFYRKLNLNRQRSYTLEAVAQDFLGYGKFERPGTVGDLRRTDPVAFLAYNLVDVVCLHRAAKKKRLIEYALRIARITNVSIQDIEHNSRVVDGLLFDEARMSGKPSVALPSSTFAPSLQRKGHGSEVFPTIVGIHVAVVALDLSEEYPSLMDSANIGFDTKLPPETTEPAYRLPTGGVYRKSPDGLVRRALRRIRTLRKAAKERVARTEPGTPEREDAKTESEAIKAVVNSVHGVVGSKYWRLGNVEMYEDTTGLARLQLQWNKRHLEDSEWLSNVLADIPFENYPLDYQLPIPHRWSGIVILGDTDSCYVKFALNGESIADVDFLHAEIVPRIHKALNDSYAEFFAPFGVDEHVTRVSIEGIFERLGTLPLSRGDGKTGAKKRYFGLYAFDGDKDVRGLPYEKRVKLSGIDAKRWNNSALKKTAQKKTVEMLLTGRPIEEIVRYRDHLRAEVLAGAHNDEVGTPAKLSQEIEEYDAAKEGGQGQPWYRAIVNYRNLTGKVITKDDEFRWYHLRGGVRYSRNPDHLGDDFDTFAIPLGWSLADARKAGFEFAIDLEWHARDSVDDAVRKVCPEIEGLVEAMEAVW